MWFVCGKHHSCHTAIWQYMFPSKACGLSLSTPCVLWPLRAGLQADAGEGVAARSQGERKQGERALAVWMWLAV
jgi:hypothetical protein